MIPCSNSLLLYLKKSDVTKSWFALLLHWRFGQYQMKLLLLLLLLFISLFWKKGLYMRGHASIFKRLLWHLVLQWWYGVYQHMSPGGAPTPSIFIKRRIICFSFLFHPFSIATVHYHFVYHLHRLWIWLFSTPSDEDPVIIFSFNISLFDQ